VSQEKRPTFGMLNFDTSERIFIFFDRNVTNEISNQKALYYATSNLCFRTTWQNGDTGLMVRGTCCSECCI